MKLSIEIDLDNDDFQPDRGGGAAISRVLESAASAVRVSGIEREAGGGLFDLNGNKVGGWQLERDAPEQDPPAGRQYQALGDR